MKKKRYVPVELEAVLFDESFIRTSYENDENDDNWMDGDASAGRA